MSAGHIHIHILLDIKKVGFRLTNHSIYPEHRDKIAFIIKALILHRLRGSELRSLLSNTLLVGSYIVDTLIQPPMGLVKN